MAPIERHLRAVITEKAKILKMPNIEQDSEIGQLFAIVAVGKMLLYVRVFAFITF